MYTKDGVIYTRIVQSIPGNCIQAICHYKTIYRGERADNICEVRIEANQWIRDTLYLIQPH